MKDESEYTGMTRRKFVSAVAAGTGFTVVPAHVLAGGGWKRPSQKLNIAGVGVGGMGAANLSRVESENIVALCDVDEKYAAHVFKKYPGARRWKDFRKMLEEQQEIDAVIVATPTHLHAVVSKMAMEMGKHVYTQKPLTRTIEEGRVLLETARRTGVATQMGNQGHSTGAVRTLREWIEDGAIGAVREVHCWAHAATGLWPTGIGRPRSTPPVPSHLDWDLWLGPAPSRPYHPVYHPWSWRGWWDFGNGALADMGSHAMDPPFYALQLGPPSSVSAAYSQLGGRDSKYSQAGFKFGRLFDLKMGVDGEEFPVQTSCSGPDAETTPNSSVVRYKFSARGDMPPVTLTWWDSGLRPPVLAELGHPWRSNGNLFIGDKGSISCGTHGGDMVIMPENRRNEYQPPPKKYRRIKVVHEQDWIEACKGGRPACSNFEYAARLNEMILLGALALRTGERIEWDAEKMKATNVSKAERYIRTSSRKGWRL